VQFASLGIVSGSVSNSYQLDPDPGFIRNPDPVPDLVYDE